VLTSGDVTTALDRARGTPAPGGASASGLAPETPRPETPSKGG
jgi:hypothetical protein